MTLKGKKLTLTALLVAALAFAAAGCGGGDAAAVEALPSSSCAPIVQGENAPSLILASDFPLQGSSRTQTEQIVAAIELELEERGYMAGDHSIGYQSCDDSTAQAAKWDSGKCSENANAYAANPAVIAVIGTFNSGCAAIEIPVLNQVEGGAIPLVSPANTWVCLTVNVPGCDPSEPDKFYPTGARNYLRVVAHDAYQGAAVAEFAKNTLGVTKVFILNDKEAYGLGVATNFKGAAEYVGIEVVGFEAWDPKATSYEAQFEKIKATGADAVFLGGLIDENGAQVIKDKVKVLGPNDGVKLLLPDGFTTQSTIDESGGAAAGAYLSVGGVPIDQFQGVAKEFADKLQAKLGEGVAIDPYALYGGQAVKVVLDAIAASDGTRADVLAKLFETKVTGGLLGDFEFNANGDPAKAAGAVVGFTIYKATDTLVTETTISPSPEAVTAAGG